ncbi:Auxin-induced protein 6B [Glycine max]|nr:Auxin-induced protein 6B [Glycine max]
MKVKKGWLAIQVEEEGSQRFVIPISYLYHPLFKHLLDNGYHTEGPLKLPCSVDDFLHLRERIHYPSPPTSLSSSSSWPTSSRLYSSFVYRAVNE